MVDISVQKAVVYDKFQFERNGYFSVDPDSKPGQVALFSFYDHSVWSVITACNFTPANRDS